MSYLFWVEECIRAEEWARLRAWLKGNSRPHPEIPTIQTWPSTYHVMDPYSRRDWYLERTKGWRPADRDPAFRRCVKHDLPYVNMGTYSACPDCWQGETDAPDDDEAPQQGARRSPRGDPQGLSQGK